MMSDAADIGRNRYLWLICLVAAMGGFLFGYDWVVIGGAKPFYEPYFGLSEPGQEWMAGWAISSALVGCLGGALSAGALGSRYGRKRLLMLAALLFAISAILTAVASDMNTFIVARILGGIGIGLASGISPMYLAEVTPAERRGRMVSINQMTIVVGVLAAQLANLAIYNLSPVEPQAGASEILASWNGQVGWRWMFAAEALPALLFLILATLIPESPRWLIKEGRDAEGLAVLEKISGKAYADREVESIRSSLGEVSEKSELSSLREPKLKLIVCLGVFLAVLQQWSGINVIFNYADEVFKAAGYDVSVLMMNIVITGMVNLVFTLVAIKTVDRWGRRPLMLLGSGGLAVIYALMGACYFFEVQGVGVLLVILLAIACYAMTLAPVTWVLLSELFPNRVRSMAMGLSVAALWVASFLLTYSFKPINSGLGAAGTFWLYGLICTIGFLIIFARLPETKGKSLEEIERELMAGDSDKRGSSDSVEASQCAVD
ncbi:sugar porter family MFS transporter [Microbulbifer sp. 2205BS26-8]|uniref:sugar porter family MFS transporter n=1 Tax=Microbulbifer sp. 2205BS26-8 TaxID=3064386 RepID=UPI00273ED5BD|nr:sugar porter family MFS transporter [Microbulbifer sp. 2205BS26-8]MDP5210800.1 sugar porter family MFS transporter [Microbulbifer sp. 2205BS26-8]